ncbi:MAG: class I SAM-dependent methyltransferase [Methylococcus sp.]|nr:MAG: class I SAM-dependent methyltransferase [Methylococcus sp.]
MNNEHQAEHHFHGAFADEYHFLQRICPPAAVMSRLVGEFVRDWAAPGHDRQLSVLELGCGTGFTTRHLLLGRTDIRLLSVDNAPAMLNQAREFLADAVEAGRLELREADALGALRSQPDQSVDIVASAYTLHNFLFGYRHQVLAEILRVLRPGGVFVNGDRYAMEDAAAHLANTQTELTGYFRILLDEMQRPDLLEQWVLHHFSDESEEHLMKLSPQLAEMTELGFESLQVHFRETVNALVSGVKPWR